MCVGCEGPIHTLFLSDPGIQSVQEAPPGGQNCNPSLVTNICKQRMRLHMLAKCSISKWQRLNSLGTRVRCASGNVFYHVIVEIAWLDAGGGKPGRTSRNNEPLLQVPAYNCNPQVSIKLPRCLFPWERQSWWWGGGQRGSQGTRARRYSLNISA